MTYQQIDRMVDSIGLPYAYHEFKNKTKQAPPYVIFEYTGDNDFHADNKNYQEITVLEISLYTREKDIYTEAIIKQILTNNDLVWEWDSSYVDSEALHRTTFYTEVIINEQS